MGKNLANACTMPKVNVSNVDLGLSLGKGGGVGQKNVLHYLLHCS